MFDYRLYPPFADFFASRVLTVAVLPFLALPSLLAPSVLPQMELHRPIIAVRHKLCFDELKSYFPGLIIDHFAQQKTEVLRRPFLLVESQFAYSLYPRRRNCRKKTMIELKIYKITHSREGRLQL